MLLIGLTFGWVAGMLCAYLLYKYKKGSLDKLAQEIIQRAESTAHQSLSTLELKLKQKELEHRSSLEKLTEQKWQKLSIREEKLDRQLTLFERKFQDVEKREKELARTQQRIEQKASIAKKRYESTSNADVEGSVSIDGEVQLNEPVEVEIDR